MKAWAYLSFSNISSAVSSMWWLSDSSRFLERWWSEFLTLFSPSCRSITILMEVSTVPVPTVPPVVSVHTPRVLIVLIIMSHRPGWWWSWAVTRELALEGYELPHNIRSRRTATGCSWWCSWRRSTTSFYWLWTNQHRVELFPWFCLVLM